MLLKTAKGWRLEAEKRLLEARGSRLEVNASSVFAFAFAFAFVFAFVFAFASSFEPRASSPF
ncbi:MAG: hypothetical protein HYS07_11430 [Chlamydiae bacterium]|nr:hypothetical protein [Chlamydiota bacterium]